jgi:proteasome lid subunit RPN8/RPN11
MGVKLVVEMDCELLQEIFESAKRVHPRETILLLRGKKKKDTLTIFELVIPPFATYGQGFAHIPLHMLPVDFSIIGTVHSHPSGNLSPSAADLNHFFGKILMIIGFPYAGMEVAVYNRDATKLALKVNAANSEYSPR